MCLLLDRESLKTLCGISAFDLRTVMALASQMGEDLHVSVRMHDLEKITGATPVSLRASIERLEGAGLILVSKRGRGPGARIHLTVSPDVACDPAILPGFETGFHQVKDMAWVLFRLARRSKES